MTLTSPTPWRRRRVLASAFAIALAAHAAPSAAQDRVLRVVAPWDFASLEPTETGYVLTRLGVGEALTAVESDGRIVGQVADSWSVDADRLTWRFHIRPGVRFHDGSAVTAAAAAASLDRARANAETLQTLPIERIAADGDSVVIRTARPFAPLPAYLTDWGGIILAPSSYDAQGRVTAIVATGYYRVTRIEGTRQLDLAAFDGYWGERPAIARVRYTAVTQGETRATIAEAGDADLVYTLLPQAVPRIDQSGRARVRSVTIPRARMIAMNLALPYFADLRVRRAISLAIDRAGIATAILRHRASTATQLLPPVLADWHDERLPALEHDPAAARRLLAEAGWTPGPDGILQKDGVAFRVEMRIAAVRPELPVMATAIQSQLRAVGIDIALRTGDSTLIPTGQRDGSLQMGFVARTYVNVPDPIGTILSDFTRDRSVWGAMNYRNDAMRALAAEYTAAFDDARRAAIRRDIVAILQSDLPVIPVSWFEHTVAVGTAVAEVEIDPYEARYLLNRVRWAR